MLHSPISYSIAMHSDADFRSMIDNALSLVAQGLRPYLKRAFQEKYGEADWIREVQGVLRRGTPPEDWDAGNLLNIFLNRYREVFQKLDYLVRNQASNLLAVRNRWAHPRNPFTLVETRQALENAQLFLRAIGEDTLAEMLNENIHQLLRRQIEPASRDQMSPDFAADPDDEQPDPAVDVITLDEPPGTVVEEPAAVQHEPAGAPPAQEAERTPVVPYAESSEGGFLHRILDIGKKQPGEPLEIRKHILRTVEKEVEDYLRHGDPSCNRLFVHVKARDERMHRRYKAALVSQETFRKAVRRHLADARLKLPPQLKVEYKLSAPGKEPIRRVRSRLVGKDYVVEFYKVSTANKATLTVLHGRVINKSKRSKPKFKVTGDNPVTIGRLAEVTDERTGYVSRRNTIAFMDADDPAFAHDQVAYELQKSVSRYHASVKFDREQGVFRIYNDQIRRVADTAVIREGSPTLTIGMKPVMLEDGDISLLGKARILFEI